MSLNILADGVFKIRFDFLLKTAYVVCYTHTHTPSTFTHYTLPHHLTLTLFYRRNQIHNISFRTRTKTASVTHNYYTRAHTHTLLITCPSRQNNSRNKSPSSLLFPPPSSCTSPSSFCSSSSSSLFSFTSSFSSSPEFSSSSYC